MLTVENLLFSYPTRQVFNNLNLEIKDSFTGIIGVNGAGKTTLVKLSLHLLHPQHGRILINGISMTDSKEYKKARIGVLHENSRFPPWIKVFDHLTWVGRVRGLTKDQAKNQASLLLQKLDLLDRWDSLVSELSAGLRQRFGLAQAFIGLPDLVFLDEPTANLDPVSRINVLEFIKHTVKEYDIQVILFSHILSDLEKYCNNVVILHEGRVYYQDSIKNLFRKFSVTEYILRFLPEEKNYVSSLLHEHQIRILDESPSHFIIKYDSNMTDLVTLFKSKDISITPYKSVLEQAFLDITQITPTSQQEKQTL